MTTILALLALAAPQTFGFKGGSIQALTSALHAQLGSSAVAEIFDDEQVIPAFKASTEGDELTKTIFKKSEYKLKRVGTMLVLYTGRVSPALYCARGPKYARQRPSPVGIDQDFKMSSVLRKEECHWTKEYQATLETGTGRILTLAALRSYDYFSGKWDSAWPYLGNPLAVSVSGVGPHELLKVLGTAVGAKVVDTPGLVALRFDPAKYRVRYIASCDDPKVIQMVSGPDGTVVSARRLFHIAAINAFSDEMIAKAFEQRNIVQNIRLDQDNEVKQACASFVKTLSTAFQAVDTQGRPLYPHEMELTKKFDLDRPGYLSFEAPSQFYIDISLKPVGSVLWG